MAAPSSESVAASRAGKEGKAHTSALAVVPPESAWAAAQEVRARHDRAFERWPPHINLLYPFVREEELRGVPERLARALARVPPFRIRLGAARTFQHKGSSTVWLEPVDDPPGSLQRLHAALLEAVPQCSERGGAFTPHLTVAKCASADAERVAREADEAVRRRGEAAAAFEVRSVAVLCRGAHTPFATRHEVPLGSGDSVPDFVPRTGAAPYDSSAWAAVGDNDGKV